MSKSRIYNAKRNIVWSLVNQVSSILLPFITRTIMIYQIGSQFVGLNGLFNSILSLLSLAELGFGSAMVFSMYEPLAKNDKKTICALLNLYKKIYTLIGLVVLVIGIVFFFFLPLIVGETVVCGINVYFLYAIYLFNTVISYFLFAYKSSLLTADQRTDLTSNIAMVITFILNISQILVLLVWKSYYLYVIFIPVATIAKNIITSITVDKMYPDLQCYGVLDKQILEDIKKRVFGLFVYRVCNVFRDSFDNIVISAFLGLTILGNFNNYHYILTCLNGFILVLKNSIVASVGNSIVLESEEKNYYDFNKIQLLYMWISSWCTVCLFCLVQPFIEFWIGKDYLFSNWFVLIYCFYFYSYKIGDISSVYRQAAGLWWQDKLRPVVEAIVNLLLNIILVKIIGVTGVMLSTILCLILINMLWSTIILYKYFFKSYKIDSYLKKQLLYFSSLLIAMFVTKGVCGIFECNAFVQIIINGVICIIVPNIILYLFYKNIPEFEGSCKMFKQFLGGIKK